MAAVVAAQVAAGSRSIAGVMIESFLEEGRQDVKPGVAPVFGKSITDACLGWERTVSGAARARRGGARAAQAVAGWGLSPRPGGRRRTPSPFGRARATIPGAPLGAAALRSLDAAWRACNYLALGMIYLRENPLLREPLAPEHVKNRLLGHWGASPALSFAYLHVSRLHHGPQRRGALACRPEGPRC